MTDYEINRSIRQIKAFAKNWNELYAAEQFEEMKLLATENVGIANAKESSYATGLIYGRQAYFDGIYGAYKGSSGHEKNLLVMDYENWEYIPLSEHSFYTIGKFSLQHSSGGVNSWLLKRQDSYSPWLIERVINT
ncbi:MAG: hypothetical protein NE330_12260 [Lentisphaeraceae bacterium]|nr:hypothetical protein [Lentisphaeraceae bacterium]